MSRVRTNGFRGHLAPLLAAGLLLGAPASSLAGRGPEALPAHVAGDDLGTWAALEQRRLSGDEAVVAYRSFVLSWPESALAEAAWGRLVTLGADDTDAGSPAERQVLARVRARWNERQRALASARRRTERPPVILDLDSPTGATALLPAD